MAEVTMVHNMEELLDFNQILMLLADQMEYIGAPKTNQQFMEIFKMAFKSDTAKLMVIHEQGHPIGFVFFNISIGMESAGKYCWINEMHVHKAYRGKGYGGELVRELKKWCKENNVVRVMGMIDESEARTRNFYKKEGFDIANQQVFSTYTKDE